MEIKNRNKQATLDAVAYLLAEALEKKQDWYCCEVHYLEEPLFREVRAYAEMPPLDFWGGVSAWTPYAHELKAMATVTQNGEIPLETGVIRVPLYQSGAMECVPIYVGKIENNGTTYLFCDSPAFLKTWLVLNTFKVSKYDYPNTVI